MASVERHETEHQAVLSLVVSPDGSVVATGGSEGTVRLHNWPGFGALRTMEGHAGPVTRLVFGPGGRHLISSSAAEVRVWKVESGELVHHIPVSSGVVATAFSPDGRQLAISLDEGRVLVRDVGADENRCDYPVSTGPAAHVYTTEGERLLSPGARTVLHTVATCSYEISPSHLGPAGVGMARSPGDELIAYGAPHGVQLIDTRTGAFQRLLRWPDGQMGLSWEIAFAGPRRVLASRILLSQRGGQAAADGVAVFVWDLDDELVPEGTHVRSDVVAVAALADGTLLTARDATVTVERLLRPTETPTVVPQVGHSEPVAAMAVVGEDRLVTVAADGSALVWDVRSGRLVSPLGAQADGVVALEEGARFATWKGGVLTVWEADSLVPVVAFVHDAGIRAAVEVPGRAAVLVATDNLRLSICGLRHGAIQPMGTMMHPTLLASNAASGKIVHQELTGSRVVLTDSESGQSVPIATSGTGHMFPRAGFSRDGSRVAITQGTGSNNPTEVAVLEASSGRLLYRAPLPESTLVHGLVPRPDGLTVLTSRGLLWFDGTGAARGQTVAYSHVEGAWSGAQSIAALADGLVLTGDRDGRVTLWDPSGARSPRFESSARGLVQAVAGARPRTVVTAHADGRVLFWDLGADEPVRQLQGATGYPANAVASAPDGTVAVAVATTVTLIGPDGSRQELDAGPADHQGRHVEALAFTQDGLVAVAAEAVTRWGHTAGGWSEGSVVPRTAFGTDAWLRVAAPHPDGSVIVGTGVVAGEEGAIYRVDPQGRVTPLAEPGHVHDVAVSPNGNHIAVSSGWQAPRSSVYDANGQLVDSAARSAFHLAFSPDGARLELLDGAGVLTSVRVEDLTYVGSRRTHAGWPRSLDVASDGMLLVGDARGGIDVLPPGAGEPAVTLHAGGEGWLIAAPSGRFWASAEGARMVGFELGGRALGFDELDLHFNRPAHVLDRLGRSDSAIREEMERAHRARLERFGAPRVDSIHELPVATVGTLPLWSEDDTLVVPVQARARTGDGLRKLVTWVDGVPYPSSEGIPIQGQAVTREVRVPLVPGPNLVQVAVVDARGRSSLREDVVVVRSGRRGRNDLYVLAVGVSDYGDPNLDLQLPAKDARDLTRALRELGGRYRQVHALVLEDARATREGILQEGRRFLEQAGPEDEVVLFFAGHGLRDEAYRYYFVARGTNPQRPSEGGVSLADVESLVDGIEPRRRTVLFDTCFAGAVDDVASSSTTQRDGVEVQAMPTRGLEVVQDVTTRSTRLALDTGTASLRRGTGAVMLASSSSQEFAFETDEWSNGAFTFSLIEGLRTRKADEDEDGTITVSEVLAYTRDRVRGLTGGRQSPMLRRANIAADFPFGVESRTPEWMAVAGSSASSAQTRIAVDEVGALAAPADGCTLVTYSDTGALRHWDLATGQLLRSAEVGPRPEDAGFPMVTVSRDGRLAVYGVKGQPYVIWNLETGAMRTTDVVSQYNPDAQISPDGTVIALAAGTDSVFLWPGDPARIWRLDRGGRGARLVSSTTVVVADHDGLWEVRVGGGSRTRWAAMPEGMSTSGSPDRGWSRDGRIALVPRYPGADVVELPTGRVLTSLQEQGSYSLSPAGGRLIHSPGVEAYVHDAATGDLVTTVRSEGYARHIGFLSEDRLVRVLLDEVVVTDLSPAARRRCSGDHG